MQNYNVTSKKNYALYNSFRGYNVKTSFLSIPLSILCCCIDEIFISCSDILTKPSTTVIGLPEKLEWKYRFWGRGLVQVSYIISSPA